MAARDSRCCFCLRWDHPLLPPLLIVLVGALLYGHTLHAPWYMDDYQVIVGNPLLTDLGATLQQFFTQRGVALFSFALNYRLGGWAPVGYHLLNILIHLAATWCVCLLLRRIFAGRPLLALLGALLFLAHPLQTQAVTYVVQRMTSLSGLCFLLALYLFIRAREALAAGARAGSARHLAWYGGALLAGLLAVFSKENAVVLPVALLLYSRFFPAPGDRRWRPLLVAVAPFLLAPLWIAAQKLAPLAGGASLLDVVRTKALSSQPAASPLHYLVTEFSVLWIYLRLLVFPVGQALDHAYPVVSALCSARSALALGGLLGLAWFAWCQRRPRPLLAFGIAWFFLTLAVESSILPLDPLFEHRLYLPIFGFVVALLGLVEALPLRSAWRVSVLAGLLLGLGIMCWQRNALWNDPVAFHEDNLRKVPASERVRVNLAKAYMERQRYADAERMAREALAINPDYETAHHNLGVALYYQDRPVEALQAFRVALHMKPDHVDALYGAAAAAIELGDLALAQELAGRLRYLNPQQAARLQQNIALRRGTR